MLGFEKISLYFFNIEEASLVILSDYNYNNSLITIIISFVCRLLFLAFLIFCFSFSGVQKWKAEF